MSNPRGWDLDHGDLPDWLVAIRTCITECPLLHACSAARSVVDPVTHGVIWAGVAYSDTGKRLDPQALLAYAAPGNVRRRAAA